MLGVFVTNSLLLSGERVKDVKGHGTQKIGICLELEVLKDGVHERARDEEALQSTSQVSAREGQVQLVATLRHVPQTEQELHRLAFIE